MGLGTRDRAEEIRRGFGLLGGNGDFAIGRTAATLGLADVVVGRGTGAVGLVGLVRRGRLGRLEVAKERAGDVAGVSR